jgi:beta-glucosidase
MVDIARDPRWGRIMEAQARTHSWRDHGRRARTRFSRQRHQPTDKIMACAKHFAAYGAAEAGRDYNTVDMSERTLREVYLVPFKAAKDAGVGSFMTAFNDLNGFRRPRTHFCCETSCAANGDSTGLSSAIIPL